MSLTFGSGIKIVAGLSVIMSLVLLGGTSWVFGTQLLNLDQKLNSSNLPDPKHFQHSKPYSKEYNYTMILRDIKSVWQKNQPILITCSVNAIFAGFIQLIVSLLVVFSSSKSIRKIARIWLISHFIVFFILLICLLSTFLMRLNHGLEMKSWAEILDSFSEILKKINPAEDYSRIIMFLKMDSYLYYGIVCSDEVAIITLFCFGVSVMHKYQNYEPQE